MASSGDLQQRVNAVKLRRAQGKKLREEFKSMTWVNRLMHEIDFINMKIAELDSVHDALLDSKKVRRFAGVRRWRKEYRQRLQNLQSDLSYAVKYEQQDRKR